MKKLTAAKSAQPAAQPASADSEMTTVRLSKPVKSAIKRLAQKDNRTLSNYISLLLTNHAREVGELNAQEG